MVDATVTLVVYSDYLCPWCNVASVRLHRLVAEYGGRLRLAWRSFLLRPRPEPRTLEAVRAYTRSWLRPAAEEEGATFRVWATTEGPPTHSVPPHVVAKAAARIGPDAFERMHAALLDAYFARNRDITAAGTLRSLWSEIGLPPAEFDRVSDPVLLDEVVTEHNAAVRAGITSVPTTMLSGGEMGMPGALPLETYRRWVTRALEAAGSA
jgi:predicted DsbA family dithiol-disulfide isomerase